MININKDAYGSKIRVNFGQTLAAATTLTMKFRPKAGADVDVTPVLGTTRVAVGDRYYDANEYLEFTVTSGMFDAFVGLWQKQATALVGTEMLSTEFELFRVTGEKSSANTYFP